MPAHDRFHDAVRHALEKEGWIITHDPLYINILGIEYYIDLGAESLLGAEKNGEKIAVEIKSFLGLSALTEFHGAFGQYLEYRAALGETHSERTLYLAIPVDIDETFFQHPFIQRLLQKYECNLLIYHPKNEEIVTWRQGKK